MARTNTMTKNTDARGRITLGEGFKNCTMLVEQQGNQVLLRIAPLVPKAEAWLHESEKARVSVRRGVKQARAREFTAGPDLSAAKAFADKIRNR